MSDEDEKRGILRGDEARDALEDFFVEWQDAWWKECFGEVLKQSVDVLTCDFAQALMKRGANPFCLHMGLKTIHEEWEKARDELEELFWNQSKKPVLGPTYTRTGKGAFIPPKKPGPPSRKRKKAKRPAAGRPPKYKTDAQRRAARQRQLDRSNARRKKKRIQEKKARDFVRKTQKAAKKVAEEIGGELMKRALKGSGKR